MIVVNYWLQKDCCPVDEFQLSLVGMINDTFDMHHDPPLIIDAIANNIAFEFKEEVVYEIYLCRAEIASDPLPEPAFVIDRVVEKKYSIDIGWYTPKVQI